MKIVDCIYQSDIRNTLDPPGYFCHKFQFFSTEFDCKRCPVPREERMERRKKSERREQPNRRRISRRIKEERRKKK